MDYSGFLELCTYCLHQESADVFYNTLIVSILGSVHHAFSVTSTQR